MSTKIHPKCPQKFTKKMSTEIHPKREVSTRIHPFCPLKFAFYVHEKSATPPEIQHRN